MTEPEGLSGGVAALRARFNQAPVMGMSSRNTALIAPVGKKPPPPAKPGIAAKPSPAPKPGEPIHAKPGPSEPCQPPKRHIERPISPTHSQILSGRSNLKINPAAETKPPAPNPELKKNVLMPKQNIAPNMNKENRSPLKPPQTRRELPKPPARVPDLPRPDLPAEVTLECGIRLRLLPLPEIDGPPPPVPPRPPNMVLPSMDNMEEEENEELYDDVANVVSEPIRPTSMIPEWNDEDEEEEGEIYDDVEATGDEEEEGISEELYEELDEAVPEKYKQSQAVKGKAMKKEEEKVDKERKKKEKELREARDRFKMNGSEIVLMTVKILNDAKGDRLHLKVKENEKIEILRVDQNPAGKWLARNLQGKIGYINNNNVEVNTTELKPDQDFPQTVRFY